MPVFFDIETQNTFQEVGGRYPERLRLSVAVTYNSADAAFHHYTEQNVAALVAELAAADLVVGDSQTVTAEAALLGTPAVRASSFTGRLEYLRELEERYQLLRSFRPDDEDAIRAAVLELADDPEVGATWQARRATMLAEQVDVTAWYLDLVDLIVGRHR